MNSADLLLRTSLSELTVAALDSVGTKKETDKVAAVMDSANYAAQDVRMKAVAAVQQWCEGGDMDDGEGAADRLVALLVGVADADKDGELTDDEQAVFSLAGEAAWDYLAGKGAAEDDLNAIFNSDDPEVSNTAAARVCEFVAGVLPDGEDASGDDLDNFVFGADALEPALDAVYKATTAIRDGKKVRIKKRIAGTVRLSAKQKLAVRKMLVKSHSAVAMVRRLKSARIGRRMGLSKG